MKRKLCRKNPNRSRSGIFRPHFDRLDLRIVLSTMAAPGFSAAILPTTVLAGDRGTPLAVELTVVGRDPAFGTTLANSPSSLTITFDRPIDPVSVGSDFVINLVGSDGSLTPTVATGNALNENPGADGQSIVITTAQPLVPGTYNLVLIGSAGVAGLDGAAVSSNDQTLGSFTISKAVIAPVHSPNPGLPVAQPVAALVGAFGPVTPIPVPVHSTSPMTPIPVPVHPTSPIAPTSSPIGTAVPTAPIVRAGVGLKDATDLGSPTGKPVSVSSTLDVASDPQDLKLYRIELPPTKTLWRLGVEVDAGRIGSPLTTTLSIFDAAGKPISTSQTGRPDYLADPYLFAGLKPGVYYIGVAGAGNVAGQPDGYDIAAATPGAAYPGLKSGGFRLQVAADPAETPTHVKTFFLNYADPTDPTPTGLTLQFDGVIDGNALRTNAADAISIVDASGTVGTAHAIGYDEAHASVTFVFDRTLPQGTYSVKLTGQGGLTDLAGQSPVSAGYPVGTLQMFLVGPAKAKSDPNDLGAVTLYDATAGIERSLTLDSNQSATYRMVITVPGRYDIQTTYIGDAPTLSVTINGKTTSLDAGVSGVHQRHDVYLSPGVVLFQVVGGKHGTSLDLLSKLPTTPFDQLLDNGVGQSAAFDLRLVSPTSLTAGPGVSSSGGDGPSLAVVGIPTTSQPSPNSTSSPSATSTFASETSAPAPGSPTGVFFASTAGLVGHPSTQTEAISVVGPVTPGGQTAMASSGFGIPQGLNGTAPRSTGPMPSTSGEIEGLGSRNDVKSVALPVVGTLGELPRPSEADLDAAMTSESSLLDRASMIVSRWLSSTSSASPEPDSANLDDSALAKVEASQAPTRSEADPQAETADLSSTPGAAVIAVAIATCQQQIGRWLKRRRSFLTAGRQVIAPNGPRSS